MRVKIVLLMALFLAFCSAGLAQSTTPTFNEYAVKVEKIKGVKVNLKSHKDAKRFRTMLLEAANGGVNFAGHYILTTWGCGTNCSFGAIIDARNGSVFFPNGLGGFFGLCDFPANTKLHVYQANSRLLVFSGMKEEGGPCGIYYLEWAGTKFRQVKSVEKKRR
jgi:hypothetical protein